MFSVGCHSTLGLCASVNFQVQLHETPVDITLQIIGFIALPGSFFPLPSPLLTLWVQMLAHTAQAVSGQHARPAKHLSLCVCQHLAHLGVKSPPRMTEEILTILVWALQQTASFSLNWGVLCLSCWRPLTTVLCRFKGWALALGGYWQIFLFIFKPLLTCCWLEPSPLQQSDNEKGLNRRRVVIWEPVKCGSNVIVARPTALINISCSAERIWLWASRFFTAARL